MSDTTYSHVVGNALRTPSLGRSMLCMVWAMLKGEFKVIPNSSIFSSLTSFWSYQHLVVNCHLESQLLSVLWHQCRVEQAANGSSDILLVVAVVATLRRAFVLKRFQAVLYCQRSRNGKWKVLHLQVWTLWLLGSDLVFLMSIKEKAVMSSRWR